MKKKNKSPGLTNLTCESKSYSLVPFALGSGYGREANPNSLIKLYVKALTVH